MTDIIDRLRNRIHDAPMPTEHLLDEAADEIERLRFRLGYMEGKHGKIVWDTPTPGQGHLSGNHDHQPALGETKVSCFSGSDGCSCFDYCPCGPRDSARALNGSIRERSGLLWVCDQLNRREGL